MAGNKSMTTMTKVIIGVAAVGIVLLVISLLVGGSDGTETGEGGGGSNELNEALMSSPVIPLDETWEGTLGVVAVSGSYDAATKSVSSTLSNTSSETICYVQTEPHIKAGDQTVGELGPEELGNLDPGQEAVSSLSVDDEPALAGVSYDGYVIHVEIFDCAGPGPTPHSSEGVNEGPEGTEGSGSDSGSEEGSNATLPLDATFDEVRAGARLVVSYDAASNSFKGDVENTTAGVLTRVRIEIHLSNGTELGPTTPMDLQPGEKAPVELAATQAAFDGWTAHVEVGSGDGSGGSSGGESAGEHGAGGDQSDSN